MKKSVTHTNIKHISSIVNFLQTTSEYHQNIARLTNNNITK